MFKGIDSSQDKINIVTDQKHNGKYTVVSGDEATDLRTEKIFTTMR